MFDCVLPTRVARTGTVYSSHGTLNLKNQRFASDPLPIEEKCACYSCRNGFSRAYIRHLLKSEEILGIRLTTLHNLYYYINLLERARNSIERGEFEKLREELQENCEKE